VIISDLVKDWGGFEKLIAELHETGEVTVEHNAILIGKSGAPRQIDVLIRHKQGLYDHLVIAECKYWNSPVERLHIDALATAIQDVGASRGVLFSTKGFQSGAITQAKQSNIDLFTVRDLTAEEWGLPGRVIDFYLQIIQPSIGNPVFHTPLVIGVPSNDPISINLEFNENGPTSTTPLVIDDGTIGKKSLEMHFAESAEKALAQALERNFIINGGAECTRYLSMEVNLLPNSPFKVVLGQRVLMSPKITFDLAIKISQSRISHDRAEQYKFALAVENCVNGTVSAASRLRDATVTTLAQLDVKPEASEGVLQNGSIFRVVIKGYFPYNETDGLEKIPIESVSRPMKPGEGRGEA
jgi:hypothetical protein